jgi:hypothetical protein
MVQRITKSSKANLAAADRLELVKASEGGWILRMWRGEEYTFAYGAADTLRWESVQDGRRFCRRFRPTLEPTSFVSPHTR